MFKLSFRALQKAVYQNLSSYEPLMAMVNQITDAPGKDDPYPYVVLGDQTSTPFETKTSFGEDTTMVFHAWSGSPSSAEVQDIMSKILEGLTYKPLEFEGFTFVAKKLVQAQVIPDVDGVTKHGIIRMRFTINN
ncbi:tail terminator [Bacillus phage 000TH010]|uniref:Head-to-tail joining protein n=1 Tax=Bacillus phage 000TH010 TaxID=2601652 RepID=A0A5P8PHQ4_9CAUD|nr:tail terminator [Bacillus phage 000TH010]QFR56233.1 head-to-tail joining protein [Bacillus phage 000TH010]